MKKQVILLLVLYLHISIAIAVPSKCNTLLVQWSSATNSHNKTKAQHIFKQIYKDCLQNKPKPKLHKKGK